MWEYFNERKKIKKIVVFLKPLDSPGQQNKTFTHGNGGGICWQSQKVRRMTGDGCSGKKWSSAKIWVLPPAGARLPRSSARRAGAPKCWQLLFFTRTRRTHTVHPQFEWNTVCVIEFTFVNCVFCLRNQTFTEVSVCFNGLMPLFSPVLENMNATNVIYGWVLNMQNIAYAFFLVTLHYFNLVWFVLIIERF